MDENAVSTQAPAGPPPGWYNDPEGRPVQRWWDGIQWGPHTQPLPGMSGPPPQADPVISTGPSPVAAPWAWAVAASPLVLLGVAALVSVLTAPDSSVSQCLLAGDIVATVFSVVAAVRDARSLRAAGDPAGTGLAWWCLLAPWAYLIARAMRRSQKTGTDWGIFAAGAVAWLLVILIAAPVINSASSSTVTFNQSGVQSQIAKDIKAQSGDTVTVSCPAAPSMSPGSKFQCVATGTDGSTAFVNVTVQDRSGDIIWQVAS